jgi:hypothetical protein
MSNAKPVLFCILSTFLLPLLVGCGSNKIVELSGAVTYEGQAVSKGTITFLPQNDKGPAAGVIADGKYTLKLAPGSYGVRIEGFKVIGQEPLHPDDPASPKFDKLEPMVPAEYNENSILKAEVLGNTKVLDFHLKKSGGNS